MGRRRAWHWRVSPNTRRSLAVADKTGSAWCREPICTPCKSVIWYHRIRPYLSLDRTANIWLMISECRSLRRVESLLDGRCRLGGVRLWSLVRWGPSCRKCRRLTAQTLLRHWKRPMARAIDALDQGQAALECGACDAGSLQWAAGQWPRAQCCWCRSPSSLDWKCVSHFSASVLPPKCRVCDVLFSMTC